MFEGKLLSFAFNESNKNGAFCFATNDINIIPIIFPALFFNLTLDVARQKKCWRLQEGKAFKKKFFNCIKFQLLKQLNNYKELWVQLSHHLGEASWRFFQTTKGFIRRACTDMTSLDIVEIEIFMQTWCNKLKKKLLDVLFYENAVQSAFCYSYIDLVSQ